MVIVASYNVDRVLYFSPGAKHTVKLSTTEYTCGNDMLVHLQLGKNLGISLNNLLRYEFKRNTDFQSEQFLFRKTYGGGAKPTTQSAFDQKLKRFDISQTVIEREILEEYSYTDKNGKTDSVQIVVREEALRTTANIDFKDAEQHKDFVRPAWLEPPGTE